MSLNPLNDISKVYLEKIAEASVKERAAKAVEHQRKGTRGDDDEIEQLQGDAQKSIDKLKKRRVTRASASLAARRVEGDVKKSNNYGPQRPKPGTVTGRRIEDPKPTGSKPSGYRIESAVPGKPAERLGAVTAIPKAERDAARERLLAKTKAKREKALDPVGQEDADIDNDGDTDKSDKYLHNRRKAIGKAMRKEALDPVGKEDDDIDNDGDSDKSDAYLKNRRNVRGAAIAKKKIKEGFSNWRQDLLEVMDDNKDNEKIKEKKVKNTIKINPTIGEAVEEIGGTLIEMVQIDNILDDFTDYEIDLLSDSLIEKVVEEVFYNYLEEGYDVEEIEEYICESIDISLSILNEAKVTFGHDTPNTEKKEGVLQKIKGAVKKVGKAVARGVGYAAGAAVRGVKAVGREAKSGYERGRSGSSSGETSTSSSSSSDSGSEGGEKKPGILSRVASKLKRGLKKAVAKGARAVSRGARNVARKMEGGETKKAEAPKAAPKKAEKPADPWEGSATTPPKAKAKATTKKAAAPKAKAPAKKKKSSKLDDLLASVRNEGLFDGRISPTPSKVQSPQSSQVKKPQPSPIQRPQSKVQSGSKINQMNSYELEGNEINEMPYQVMGSPEGGKEKKIGKPVKSKKYADARAAELEDTHKKTGGKYRSQYVEEIEIELEEGMTLKDFKANRRKLKRREASADAKKRGHVGKEWYNSGRTYSPDEAKRGRAKLDDAERQTRHRSALDPEGEDSNYSADKTKNPKKLRKQKAMGELGEERIDEKTLTKMEMKKREEIVKSMKDKASDFEKRYPGRGKEVMYATATKMAKKMAEQALDESGDWWHPDPKKDAQISGAANKMRAKENRGQDTSAQTKPDYSNRLKPGESYMDFAKRKGSVSTPKQKPSLLSRVASKLKGKGGSSSLSNASSSSGTTGKYQVGASRGYGISGIKLAD